MGTPAIQFLYLENENVDIRWKSKCFLLQIEFGLKVESEFWIKINTNIIFFELFEKKTQGDQKMKETSDLIQFLEGDLGYNVDSMEI